MRRSVRTSYLGLAVLVNSGWAQVMKPDGCLLLSGTITCPPWNTAWVNPNELVNAGYPEFANVTDLASFDAAAVSYIGNLDEYRAVKFGNDGLGCTNASSAVIRYSRTVLCSTWLNSASSLACFNRYSQVDRDIGPKYVCQDTCNQYAANEHTLTQNPQYCPTDPTAGNRYVTLIRDYSSCTDWLSPLTNNTNTCIQGDRNEGGCGFGGSSAQLCAHCNTTTPDDCCYQSNTDIGPCGYVLAARPTSTTSSSATSTGTGGAGIVGGGSKGLSGGQIAGIVIGSVIGGLLLLGLLIGLVLCCGILGGSRRNKRENESEKAYYGSGSGSDNEAGLQDRPSTGAAFATLPRGSATTASPSMSTSAPGMPGALAAPLPLAAGAVPGVGERSVLASIKDENQSGEHLIYPNSMVTVLWPYTASMGDEVTLIPGMRLKVSRLYDDAWATGQVTECAEDPSLKGREGAFPLVCVTQANVPVVAGRS